MSEVEDSPLHRPYLRFAFAALIVAAAILLRLAIVRLIGAELPPFITFYPAVMVAALLCGFGPGLLATVLCALAADYWILPPRGSFVIANPAEAIALAFFSSMGVFLSCVAEAHRRSQQRVAALDRELALHESREELRRSEEQFETLANAIPQLCWMANADGWIFWYNQRWYGYTGTTPEQMEGWGWQSVHDPEALPKVMARWQGSIATGEPFDMVFPLRGADGEFRPFLTRVMPVKDADGKIVRWFGTNTDISEQKRAEIELRKSKERLDLAVEVAGLGEWELNLKDHTSVHSLRHGEIFGYSSPPLDWSYEKFLGHVLPELRDAVDRQIHSGSSWSVETKIRRADGEVRWIWVRGRRRVNDAGQVVRMFGVVTDITERKQAEEERARLAAIVESSGDAIISKDLNGIVSSWNQSAERLFGYSAQEMIGQPITLIIPHERLAEETEFLERLQRGECIAHYETVRVDKQGRSIDVSVTLSPVCDSTGAVVAISKSVRDITEWRQAQEALRSSQATLQGVVGSAMDAIISVDDAQRIVVFNQAAESIFQCAASEAVGSTLDRFIPQRLREAHREHLQRFGSQGVTNRSMTSPGMLVGVRSNGEEFPIEATISQVQAAGQTLYTVILRDITERMQAEEVLRRQAEMLRLSFDAIIVWRLGGSIESWNRGAQQLYGYDESEALGRVTHELLGTIHPAPWLEIEAALHRFGHWEGELRHITKDGREVTVVSRHQLIVGSDGVERILETNRDMTEHKRAEQALLASEHRWATTLQSIGDAVISTDSDGYIDFMNEVAQKLTGWTLEEAKGKELTVVFDIMQEVTRIRPESPVAKVIRLGQIVGLANHTVLIHRDGNEIPIEDSAAPIRDSQGQMEGVVLVFHDCLEQRKVEAALRSSERLATTGRLAATIAHEIHNPLDAVGNLLFLIREEAKEESTREYASMASGELARVTQMTQQMLGFQREATRPMAVKIGELLENVVALYDRKIKTAGIRLEQQIDHDLRIVALPGELRQIFANLLGNAIEAVGPRRGTITLRAYPSQDRRRGLPGLCIVVADNGPGIPPGVRNRIFEPFFTTKGESGTGLGLWITSDILRKYDGTMRLRSCTHPERSGTCFSIFLPFQIHSESTPRS